MTERNDQTPGSAPASMGRRLGPSIAAVSLVVTLALLVWMTTPPSGLAGPISDAPFTLDAMLVTSPERGCVDLVDGTGVVREVCVDDEDADEAFFTSDGELIIGTYEHWTRIDPETGAVLGELDGGVEPDRGRDVGDAGGPEQSVWVDESAVYLVPPGGFEEVPGPDGKDPFERLREGDPLLELDGPPGYRFHDATLSPDGRTVVVVDSADRVLVAPVDGSAGVYEWYDASTWVNLWDGVRWG